MSHTHHGNPHPHAHHHAKTNLIPRTDGLFLRSYLSDEYNDDHGALKSAAFSPDIIFQYATLHQDASTTFTSHSNYTNFTSLAIIPYENNHIYIRGYVPPRERNVTRTTAVCLRAVPSELILWPQIWKKERILEPGPVVVDSGGEVGKAQIIAPSVPFTFRPSNLGGVNYAFIATESTIDHQVLHAQTHNHNRLRDHLSPLPRDARNWREYYEFVKNDTKVTYYNVMIADPTSPIISTSTRIRLFENEHSRKSTDLHFTIEYSRIPSNTQISLSSDTGDVLLARAPISSPSVEAGLAVTLPSNYDGMITLHIFPPTRGDGEVIDEKAWVSLQVSALDVNANGVVEPELGEGVVNSCLLGAFNVVFSSDGTRNARFASEASELLKKKNLSAVVDVYEDQEVKVHHVMNGSGSVDFLSSSISNASTMVTAASENETETGGEYQLVHDYSSSFADHCYAQYTTTLQFPPIHGLPHDATWSLFVNVGNAPIGTQVSLSSSGPSFDGYSISLAKTAASATRNIVEKIQFCGIPSSGYRTKLVLSLFYHGDQPHVHLPNWSESQLHITFTLLVTTSPVAKGKMVAKLDSNKDGRIAYAGTAETRVVKSVGTKKVHSTPPPVVEKKKYVTLNLNHAHGWWFRGHVSDLNTFPRTLSFGVWSQSPDIQLIGSHRNHKFKLTDYGSGDYSDAHRITVEPGSSNFIVVRGHSTASGESIEARLFATPNNLFTSPNGYADSAYTIKDHIGGETVWAKRTLVTGEKGLNVIESPFDFSHPESPARRFNGDHYNLVAETRKITNAAPDPNWPHENKADFRTGDDFNVWLAMTPTVAYRNVAYIYADVQSRSEQTFTTAFTIPAGQYGSSAEWTLAVTAKNVSVGSSWALSSNGAEASGLDIGFPRTEIRSINATQGIHFSGLPSTGYTANLSLQWWSNGHPLPKGDDTGLQFSLVLLNTKLVTSAASRIGSNLPAGAEDWPYFVGSHYPTLPDRKPLLAPEPLLPTYTKKSGRYTYPHAGALKQAREKKARLGSSEEVVEPVVGFVVGADTYKVIPV